MRAWQHVLSLAVVMAAVLMGPTAWAGGGGGGGGTRAVSVPGTPMLLLGSLVTTGYLLSRRR